MILPGAGNVQTRRPFTAGSSSYHSLQTKVENRVSAGLTLLAAYTWSKLIDNSNINSYGTGAGNVVQDPRNLALERGPGAFDVTQRLVTSFAYELPFGKSKRYGASAPAFARAIMGGWQIGGITQFQSGFPFTPALGTPDPANVGREYARRPDRIGSGKLDSWTVERYFDVTAFRTPAAFGIGNSGRNILRGPGIRNWDLSAIKNTTLSEKASLQFRWELFNAWNTSQFFSPDTNTDVGSTGGRILSARDPRIMQFALKLYF